MQYTNYKKTIRESAYFPRGKGLPVLPQCIAALLRGFSIIGGRNAQTIYRHR